ncbi:MAG: hypothetical protein BWX80_03073 [Candidatus Hydrogenedentes bacterium ADurb.Bin101]|nr:MAG: hypothetical protein BWX80_03073 [Candidatus Hydrogenedentes bacterium ADurb.Bin101]
MPARASSLTCFNTLTGFSQGAPHTRKGVLVPRPSFMFRPSKRQVPIYINAVSGVGILGEGGAQGSAQASNCSSRHQFSAVLTSTCREVSAKKSRLKYRASSPNVMPCRTGMGAQHTGDP